MRDKSILYQQNFIMFVNFKLFAKKHKLVRVYDTRSFNDFSKELIIFNDFHSFDKSELDRYEYKMAFIIHTKIKTVIARPVLLYLGNNLAMVVSPLKRKGA